MVIINHFDLIIEENMSIGFNTKIENDITGLRRSIVCLKFISEQKVMTLDNLF